MRWGMRYSNFGRCPRRRWLAGVVGGAIACGVRQPSFASQRPSVNADGARATQTNSLPYIDAHSHVWSPDIERWPLVNGQTRADLKPLSFTPEELLKLAEPEGVGRVVLIQHSGYHLWDNSYLIDCAARMPGR